MFINESYEEIMRRWLGVSSKIAMIAACAVTVVGVATPRDAAACHTQVGNFVWKDNNGNGIQDDGEPGIPNVKILLSGTDYNSRAVILHDSTDSNGRYLFGEDNSLRCGTYQVSVEDPLTVPEGYSVTAIGVADNDASTDDSELDSDNPDGTLVVVNDETPNLTIDFGYRPPCAGAIGNFVWNDANNNGVQDADEVGISGIAVTLSGGGASKTTDANGSYGFPGLCEGAYTICSVIPSSFQTAPANQGNDDAIDSDGTSNGQGFSCTEVMLPFNVVDNTIDFGFYKMPPSNVGTGTPGYWKNHPEAWPVESITIGGVSYTKADAIAWMQSGDGDKTLTMFRSLVSAKLNVLNGANSSCIDGTITMADTWMAEYGPVGSNIHASSPAWRIGEPLYYKLDQYNNGYLCALPRD